MQLFFVLLLFCFIFLKVTGKAVIDGKEFLLDGPGFVSKSLTNVSPHKIATRIEHCKLITPDVTLALCKIHTPKACDNVTYTWGFLVENGEVACATTTADGAIFSLSLSFVSFVSCFFSSSLHLLTRIIGISAVWLEKGELDPETKYVVPTKVQFKWEGKTRSGKDFKAEVLVNVKKENLMCRFDLLGHIPTVFRFPHLMFFYFLICSPLCSLFSPFCSICFRMIVEKLIAKPIFYQYYEAAEGTITIGDETKTVSGRCMHEYHFIN